MIEPQELAKIIRMHRKAAGLSRVQLAELADVGKTVIYDIENGKESVQCVTLRKIFKVLNISIVLISPFIDSQQNTLNEKS